MKKKTAKKVDLGKVTDVVKKIPAFLKRMKAELEKLVGYIEKAEAALAALAGLQLLTKEQKAEKKLLDAAEEKERRSGRADGAHQLPEPWMPDPERGAAG